MSTRPPPSLVHKQCWESVVGLDSINGLHLASIRDQFQQAFYEEEQGEQRVHDMEDIS
jgi:transcriptional regulator of nitric oxide reductase